MVWGGRVADVVCNNHRHYHRQHWRHHQHHHYHQQGQAFEVVMCGVGWRWDAWIVIDGAANFGRIDPWRGAFGARCGECDVGRGASVALAAQAPGRGFCCGRSTQKTKPWDYRKCHGSGGTRRGSASGTDAIEGAAAIAGDRS